VELRLRLATGVLKPGHKEVQGCDKASGALLWQHRGVKWRSKKGNGASGNSFYSGAMWWGLIRSTHAYVDAMAHAGAGGRAKTAGGMAAAMASVCGPSRTGGPGNVA
jgi:hypothetical protein